MSIDLIMLLLFGSVIIGLLYAAYRINNEEQALATQAAAADLATAPTSRPASAEPVPARAAGRTPRAVYEIERRLRHELALAQAFSDDPSPETLWLQ